MFIVEKRFSGYSCCFRQHKATSHCRFLHGYSPLIFLKFAAKTLDERNWVIDFGNFGQIKEYLTETFDHKVIVGAEDYAGNLSVFERMQDSGLCKIIIVPEISCESFAKMIFEEVQRMGLSVPLHSVKFVENENNSATYQAD